MLKGAGRDQPFMLLFLPIMLCCSDLNAFSNTLCYTGIIGGFVKAGNDTMKSKETRHAANL